MKKFLIFFMVCFCVLFSNAQVKNKYGQDVVRKVEVYMVKQNKPYITIEFNYSNSLSLEEIHFIAPSTGKVVIKRSGDEITRVDYNIDGKIRNDLKYHYKVINNLITSCDIDNIGIDGNVLRYSYLYRYDEGNKLLSADKRVFTRERYEEFSELSDRYREAFLWNVDGVVYTTSERGWQWKIGQKFDYPFLFKERTYNFELENDINIDLFLLYDEIGNFDRLERITEWCGKHPSFLIEKNNGVYFDYTYDNENGGLDLSDDRGKMTQMDVYNCDKRLEKIFKISYWE